MMTKAQVETLQFLADNRGKHGVYTHDRHEEETTFASLRRRRLIGYFLAPRTWVCTRYKITPRGRRAIQGETP